jgi:hypothetical protein
MTKQKETVKGGDPFLEEIKFLTTWVRQQCDDRVITEYDAMILAIQIQRNRIEQYRIAKVESKNPMEIIERLVDKFPEIMKKIREAQDAEPIRVPKRPFNPES